jgi:FkbM family methyltransferase
MEIQEVRLEYKGIKFPFLVRSNTQDEPMARGEVIERDYYRQYGKLEIKPGDTVFDLGSNCGSFSIVAGIDGAKKIIAVEPHPDTISLLIQNLERNKNLFAEPVTLFEGAVMGKANDKAPLYLNNDPFGTGSHTLTLSALNKPVNYKTIEVKAITLDQLIEMTGTTSIDFLKADIEGAEYEVIKNCKKLNIIRQMSFEWHHGVNNLAIFIIFLKQNGFNIAWVEGDNERGKLQVRRAVV